MGDLVHDIFVDLHAVGSRHQRAELQTQLVLGGGDFMVMLVAGQAHFEHGGNHPAAQVDAAVDGGDGEIAALGTRTVRHVAAFIIATAVDRQFDVVERVEIGRASGRARVCQYV